MGHFVAQQDHHHLGNLPVTISSVLLYRVTFANTFAKQIAHESWVDYMHEPSKGLTGSVVALYIAGEACGALLQTAIGDKIGRIRFMQLMVSIL